MSDLFIPKKIKVGFQKRDGTYTGLLAYVIYYDNKGVLRKEKSWEGWRSKNIKPEEYDNEPQDGFALNKDVKRFNWSHFGSNRSYIRMYDPRGIEFEVTPENLIGILTETDCLKRGLQSKFVYAWKGTELVLLPCNSEEYVKAKENTERQDQDISAKDLKPGCSYTTKKGEEVIYMGKFHWHEWDRYTQKGRNSKKKHVFAYPKKPEYGGLFFYKNDVKFLAVLNSPDAVINYADLVDKWNADSRSSTIEKWEFTPDKTSPDSVFEESKDRYGYTRFKHSDFIERVGNDLVFWSFSKDVHSHYGVGEKIYMYETGILDTDKMIYSTHNWNQRNPVPKEKILERVAKSVKVKIVLSNGKKVAVNSVNDIG
jgi:hypothetical protein